MRTLFFLSHPHSHHKNCNRCSYYYCSLNMTCMADKSIFFWVFINFCFSPPLSHLWRVCIRPWKVLFYYFQAGSSTLFKFPSSLQEVKRLAICVFSKGHFKGTHGKTLKTHLREVQNWVHLHKMVGTYSRTTLLNPTRISPLILKEEEQFPSFYSPTPEK